MRTSRRRARAALALLLLAAASAGGAPEAGTGRGDEVAAALRAYVARLAAACAALADGVALYAPALVPRLACAPPEPAPYGYDLLPPLVADGPPPATPPPVRSTAFSWPRTAALLARETERLAALEADVGRLAALAPDARAAACERAIATWGTLDAARRTAESQVAYNRFWQAAVAAEPERFVRQTALHDAVLELDRVRTALRTGATADLRRREAALAREVHAHADRLAEAPFVRVTHPRPHRWVVRVPVWTDIADAAFLEAFRRAVETVWRVRDGEDEFRVRVGLRVLASRRVHPRGAHVDVAAHAAAFPPGGAVLTTGAPSTYSVPGRYVALGPHPVAPHVLAHEFGHLLGFDDVYVRGYRDLGEDGYEILEVVPAADDIMGAPGWGRVRRRHFERLIERATPRS